MMSRVITFKSKLNKSGSHYYVYIPKAWNSELEEYYRNRKRIKVTIELEE